MERDYGKKNGEKHAGEKRGRDYISLSEKPGFDTGALTRVAASPTEGPDDVQRCNDGAIINQWYRHAYANHPLDLGTQRLLTATMPPFAGIRCAQLDLRSRPARTNQ